MMIEDIISKIENVKDRNLLRISEADRKKCESIQWDYDTAIANLDKWEQLFNESLEKDFKDKYTVKTSYDGTLRYSYDETGQSDLLDNMFFPGEALEDIQSRCSYVNRYFRRDILNHFNAAYGLCFSQSEIDDDNEITHYQQIIDWLFGKLNGESLSSHYQKKQKSSFRDLVCWSPRNISRDKNKINIGWTKNLFSNDNGKYLFNEQEEHYRTFMYGLGYFDRGKADTIPLTTICPGAEVAYARYYKFTESAKLAGIKFYKSGKIVLMFHNEEHAISFCDYANDN